MENKQILLKEKSTIISLVNYVKHTLFQIVISWDINKKITNKNLTKITTSS